MRKTEIARRIAGETGLTHTKAEEVVNAILNEMKSALAQGDSALLRGFGAFHVRYKGARTGRNPRTGDEAPIAPRRVVQFKAGKPFRDVVNQSPSAPVGSQIFEAVETLDIVDRREHP
jgi:integration host factor subunit alpha